jgi:predicted site-specific integrase-resolvase
MYEYELSEMYLNKTKYHIPTLKEVLELFRISRQTLSDWRRKGIIKVIKIDKKILIRKEEVERLLKENEGK